MKLIPYFFLDAPQVLDCSVTPIPASGSSPLQVIADTGNTIGFGMRFNDSTGAFFGFHDYAEHVSFGRTNYRYVCHRCAPEAKPQVAHHSKSGHKEN